MSLYFWKDDDIATSVLVEEVISIQWLLCLCLVFSGCNSWSESCWADATNHDISCFRRVRQWSVERCWPRNMHKKSQRISQSSHWVLLTSSSSMSMKICLQKYHHILHSYLKKRLETLGGSYLFFEHEREKIIMCPRWKCHYIFGKMMILPRPCL